MLIRVRSNVGVWRVDGLDAATATIADVQAGIAQTRPNVVYTQALSSDPAGRSPVDPSATLQSQGLAQHGMMLHCRVDPSTCVEITNNNNASSNGEDTLMANSGDSAGNTNTSSATASSTTSTTMRRVIDKDGQIKMVPVAAGPSAGSEKGFRKGMMALRDMKMSWTLADFVAMDSQYQFKIQRQASAICPQVSFDATAIQGFQAYCAQFQFQRKRMAFLYGRYEDYTAPPEDKDNSNNNATTSNSTSTDQDTSSSKPRQRAVVEAIYEPPQEVDSTAAEGFVLLDDPREETVEQMAEWLGLQKVGWIYCHEPREKGFTMSNAELIMAAEYQLEAAEGVNETPFVTVKVAQGLDGLVSVEAFQMSQQCLAMVAEEALEVNVENPKVCSINETFTAIQEGKESKTVENDFFLTVVPITQHTSDTFVSDFPRLNRDLDARVPNHDALKSQLQKAGTAGWTLEDRLADLNLLVYLADFLDESDLPRICAGVAQRSLDDGYKILIKSLAGLDGSY